MNLLNLLILSSLFTIALFFWKGDRRYAGWIGAMAYAIQLIILISFWDKLPIASSISFTVLGNQLHWEMTGLGWFFAIIMVGLHFSPQYIPPAHGEKVKKISAYNILH